MRTLLVALILSSTLIAQGEAPAMSEVNKLKIQIQLRELEIYQLRAQAAQRDFETTKNTLAALITSLEVKGYLLDVQTQTYTKAHTTETESPK